MSRLIDADALKENLQNHYGVVEQDCGVSKDFVDGTFMGLDAAMFEIDSAHTIDAIPVEWLEAQISPYRDKLKVEGKGVFNATVRAIIYRWQEEQEAR